MLELINQDQIIKHTAKYMDLAKHSKYQTTLYCTVAQISQTTFLPGQNNLLLELSIPAHNPRTLQGAILPEAWCLRYQGDTEHSDIILLF